MFRGEILSIDRFSSRQFRLSTSPRRKRGSPDKCTARAALDGRQRRPIDAGVAIVVTVVAGLTAQRQCALFPRWIGAVSADTSSRAPLRELTDGSSGFLARRRSTYPGRRARKSERRGGGGASNLRTFALETAGDTNGVMSQSSRNYSDIYIVSQQNRSFIEESKSRRTSADPSHWSKTNKFHFSFPLVMSYCEQQKFMIARISQMLLDEFCFRLFFPAVRVFECCCSRCCQSTNWKLDRNLVAGTLL